jgi:hypothetical protein
VGCRGEGGAAAAAIAASSPIFATALESARWRTGGASPPGAGSWVPVGRRRRKGRVALEESRRSSEQVGEVERAAKVLVGLGPGGPVGGDRLVVGLARIEDERRLGQRALEPVADREAAHVRELGREHHEAEGAHADPLHRLLARADDLDREAGGLEGTADLVGKARVGLD